MFLEVLYSIHEALFSPCTDLSKDPGILIIAWKLNAKDKKAWEFSREAFVGGWSLESCFNIDTMKKKLKLWRDELKQDARFKSFYWFVFDYLKEDRTILTMEEVGVLFEIMNKGHHCLGIVGN